MKFFLIFRSSEFTCFVFVVFYVVMLQFHWSHDCDWPHPPQTLGLEGQEGILLETNYCSAMEHMVHIIVLNNTHLTETHLSRALFLSICGLGEVPSPGACNRPTDRIGEPPNTPPPLPGLVVSPSTPETVSGGLVASLPALNICVAMVACSGGECGQPVSAGPYSDLTESRVCGIVPCV